LYWSIIPSLSRGGFGWGWVLAAANPKIYPSAISANFELLVPSPSRRRLGWGWVDFGNLLKSHHLPHPHPDPPLEREGEKHSSFCLS